jgi:hypothetical protein
VEGTITMAPFSTMARHPLTAWTTAPRLMNKSALRQAERRKKLHLSPEQNTRSRNYGFRSAWGAVGEDGGAAAALGGHAVWKPPSG